MSIHAYHYFAQRIDGTTITTIDGIARLRTPINNMEGYESLKSMISLEQELKDDGNLTIHSLSYLGTHPTA